MERSKAKEIVLPFYLLCDTSASMLQGTPSPYDTMCQAIADIMDFCMENPQTIDCCHLGIISFSDDAHEERRLTRLPTRGISMPKLRTGNFTDYAQAFTTTNDIVRRDIGELHEHGYMVKRPVVFLITDGNPQTARGGQPYSKWSGPLDQLKAVTAPRKEGRGVKIAIVAMGFDNAAPQTLAAIAQEPGVACIQSSQQFTSAKLMEQLMSAIMNSMITSAMHGELVFNLPEGMRLC